MSIDFFGQGMTLSPSKLQSLVPPAQGLVSATIDFNGNLVPLPIALDPSLVIVNGKLTVAALQGGQMGTGAWQIPVGNTAQRPDSGSAGLIRFNSQTVRFEFSIGGSWKNLVRLDGDTMTGNLTVPGLTIGGTTNLGNTSTNYVQITGSAGNPTIAAVGPGGANVALILRGLGTAGLNFNASVGGVMVQLVPPTISGAAVAGTDTLQFYQPGVAGSPFVFQLASNNMATGGGLSLKNMAISLDQILVYAGDSLKRQNHPFQASQTISGISTNIGGAYGSNWWLTTLQNFQSGEGFTANLFQTRTGTGAAVRGLTAVGAYTSQMLQPLKTTDLAWLPNHAYTIPGTICFNDGGMWMLITPGTSGPAPGPHATQTTVSTNITDGTCVWNLEDDDWNYGDFVAFAATSTTQFNSGGTATNPIGNFWGACIGAGHIGVANGYLNGIAVVELDDFVKTPIRATVGMQIVKMGQSGYTNDQAMVVNGSFGLVQGYWNPFLVMQGILPGGTAFSTEDQWQGLVSHAAGGVDMNSLLPDGLGPGGGGYYIRWGGLGTGGASGHIDSVGALKQGFGAIRPTATGLIVDTRRWKFTGVSAINTPGAGFYTGQSAKDQHGNIVIVDVDGTGIGGTGGVVSVRSIVTAGYKDTPPSGPQTFYPMVTGSTVGPFLNPPPVGFNIRPVIVPFTATLTYALSTDPNITLGATTDAVRVPGALSVSGATALAAATAPTRPAGDNSANIATTAFVAAVRETMLTRSASVAASQFSGSGNAMVDDTTNNTLNARTLYRAPFQSAIVDLVVACLGWVQPLQPELDMPGTYTVTAALEYPAGVFTPLYTDTGSRSLTVTPGRTQFQFQPAPITIAAGDFFWIKTFVSWSGGHFWMSMQHSSLNNGEWTKAAVGASDLTLDPTTQTPSLSMYGFSPVVFGKLGTQCAALGILGDSISCVGANSDPTYPGSTWLSDAMRGQIPCLNASHGGDDMALYLGRSEGRSRLFRNSITHLLMSYIRNGLGGSTLAVQQGLLQSVIAPFLQRGVKVYVVTALPTTTSTDGWATRGNQTVTSTEALRQQYNSWIRGNYASLGITGLFDWARAVDPTDSGLWNVDAGVATGGARAVATLSAGSVASLASISFLGNDSTQNGGPNNATGVPLVFTSMPGDPGSGAAGTCDINSSGRVSAWHLTAGGSGYLYPPMVTPQGRWTADGVHPSTRGCQQIIAATQIRPELFVL